MKKTDIVLAVVLIVLVVVTVGRLPLGAVSEASGRIQILPAETTAEVTSEVSPSPVPATMELSPTPSPTPTSVAIPFGELEAPVTAKASYIKLDPVEEIVAGAVIRGLNNLEVPGGGVLSTAPEGVEIPVDDNWGPPVPVGETFTLTWGGTDSGSDDDPGNDRQFMSASYFNDYGWNHYGDDGKSSNGLIAAMADSIVLAVYNDLSECKAEKFGGGGRTVVLATRTSAGVEAHHTYSHLAFPDDNGFGDVAPGQFIKGGEAFVRMGSTYNRACGSYSTGAHLHFQLAIDEGSGFYWVDPVDYPILGTRK